MTDRAPHSFQTTHWTQVIAAQGDSPDAKHALRTLCETYYAPVELFVRRYRDQSRTGQQTQSNSVTSQLSDNARDLTHEFFAKLLEGRSLDHVDRTRGRFRSYLLGAVKHFLADQQDYDRALKRGGHPVTQSLSSSANESSDDHPHDRHDIVDPQGFPPDAYFDRHWALTVVQAAMDTLRSEAEASEELERFEVLQRWLVTPSGHDTALEAARSLNMTDGAFKVAVHRLRKRYRQIVTERISATVDDPAEVQDELNYLITAITFPEASPSSRG